MSLKRELACPHCECRQIWHIAEMHERGEAAADRPLDAHRVERDDAAVAFDDGGRQRDFFDAFDDAGAAGGEAEVKLSDAI